jgi:acyl carrier protein
VSQLSPTAEIQLKVVGILEDALNADLADIKPDSTLQGDLGAESIDMLDIIFRLEREFDIKIPRNELFPDHIFNEDPTSINDGKVTPEGLTKLKVALPFSDFTSFETNPRVENIQQLFTVNTIIKFVQHKLSIQ